MTTPNSAGPCQPWTPIWCGTISPSVAAVSGTYVGIATEVLWAKSGRQFDSCTFKLRPCRSDCWGNTWPWSDRWMEFGSQWPYPYNYAGQWFNLGCGGCPGTCSCTVLYSTKLPMPVVDIIQIKVDGGIMPSGSYKVYDHELLVRTDGSPWPLCNDLNKDDDAVGTWSVTARFGTDVPPLGQLAVGELTEQMALACVSPGSCQLPTPVQSLVRQGVSMTFLDPNTVFADGKIGLYNSDLFISTYNPQGISARARAYDVDSRAPNRRTWPP